jgi:DNA adenine methylase
MPLNLIKRQGGKYWSCKKVLKEFPTDYDTYVEPFVGGGSIYLNTRKVDNEIINDLDPLLIELYIQIQNNYLLFESTVNGEYNEEDFYRIKKELVHSNLGKLVKDYILKKTSYLGCMEGFAIYNGKKNFKIKKNFLPIHNRLKDTIIHNENYNEIITKYDSPTTFFYLDPPYENSSKNISDYNDINLEQLRNQLQTIKGRFLLSLNDSENNRELFKEFKINSLERAYSIQKRKVNELLIKNY